MHTARPVGLSEDGQSLIVETGDGERISILADSQLRQLLRSVRPRPQLEIEMETAMTPREIQMKIRAGASVEEIADASGMPIHRVEAFAAPVIAERNHIAGLAQSGSVRRRGEPTGHRTLQLAIIDRLRERGVDPESVQWDAFKMDDGRWSVSAGYRLEQADREAVFYFDQRGRFSVAGNDEGRWAIGEQLAAAKSPTPATSPQEDADTEPTLKLSGPADELALLRAVETEDGSDASSADEAADANTEDETADTSAAGDAASAEVEIVEEIAIVEETVSVSEPEPESDTSQAGSAEQSQMDLLYDLLGHGGYAEDSPHVYEGLTDAAAVPEVADSAWASDEDQDYPAEPEQEPEAEAEVDADASASTASASEPVDDVEETPDQPTAATEEPADEPRLTAVPSPEASESEQAEPAAVVQLKGNRKPAAQTEDGATQDTLPGADVPVETEQSERDEKAATQQDESAEQTGSPNGAAPAEPERPAAAEATEPAKADEPAAEEAPKPAPKSKKRKRASVPSWDEIMFGSPKAK